MMGSNISRPHPKQTNLNGNQYQLNRSATSTSTFRARLSIRRQRSTTVVARSKDIVSPVPFETSSLSSSDIGQATWADSPLPSAATVFVTKEDVLKGVLKSQMAKTEYVWPTSDTEEKRYVEINTMWRKILKGCTLTPPKILEKGARVLYIGRDKFWALDMAMDYPNLEIHCVDYLNFQGASFRERHVPPNCFFYNFQPGELLPWPDGHFDLVGSRWLVFVLTEADWKRHLSEMVRVTKKGGYVENVNLSTYVFDGGPVMERAMISVMYAMRANGHNPSCAKAVHKFVDECEQLKIVRSERYSIPLGPWHDDPEWREHGHINVNMFVGMCQAGIAHFSHALCVPIATLEQDIVSMKEELKSFKSYQKGYLELAQKI